MTEAQGPLFDLPDPPAAPERRCNVCGSNAVIQLAPGILGCTVCGQNAGWAPGKKLRPKWMRGRKRGRR